MFTLIRVLGPFALVLAVSQSAATTALEDQPGKWVGEGVQGEHRWSMEVTPGEDGLRVDYPSLDCGGSWISGPELGELKADMAFNETLDYGHDNCIDNGTVRLFRTPEGLNYQWSRTPDSPVEATGTLQFRSEMEK